MLKTVCIITLNSNTSIRIASLFYTRSLHVFLFLAVNREVALQDTCPINMNYTDKYINTNGLSNDTNFDNNAISFSDNGLDHVILNYKNNDNNSARHANSNNAIISPNDCDTEDSRAKTVNLNVTSSYKNGNSHETVDSNNSTNNSTNGNVSDNVTSCDNGKCHSVIDNAINAKNTMDDTDCDNNNIILSWNNRRNHNAINDENNVSKLTRHANSDNAMILSNDCDKNNGVNTMNLNETFSCDNGNSCETVNDMDANNLRILIMILIIK